MLSFAHRSTVGTAVLSVVVLLSVVVSSSSAVAPTGGFLAVLNGQYNNGDSRRSVLFYDADDPSTPLFGVRLENEFDGGGSSGANEELTAIAADPATGDIFVAAFDSGTTGVADSLGDTQGDLDLYKIHFSDVYDFWSDNHESMDVRNDLVSNATSAGGPNGWGAAVLGSNNSGNLDYVLYGTTDEFTTFHSNTYVLSGASEKVGEIVRGNGGDFYEFALDLRDSEKLFMLDDSVEPASSSPQHLVNDHSLRVIEKVTGPASISTPPRGGPPEIDYSNGGYNGNTTEDWESTLKGFINADPASHSEPRAFAYYDAGNGVRGYWTVDGDYPSGPTDKIGFLQLDASDNVTGFRGTTNGGSAFFLLAGDDPAGGIDGTTGLGGAADGKIHEVFVDANGDLILVESGFLDNNTTGDGVHVTDEQPGVLRISVDYDENGAMGNNMTFGAWETKLFLNPSDATTANVEYSQYVTYDQANNVLYFFSPGNGAETHPYEMDIYALDLDTGVTTSYLDVDESISLFGGIGDDHVEYFFLEAAGLPGDFNGDDSVDAADYALWRDHLGDGDESALNGNGDGVGGVDEDDYALWREHFGDVAGSGSGAGAGAGAVPEPASLVLLAIGLVGLGLGRRKRS